MPLSIRSVVVDHVQQRVLTDDIAEAHIYCDYKAKEVQTTANLVASLVQQLVQQVVRQCRVIPDEVTTLYKRHILIQTRPSLQEWSELLQLLATRLSRFFVIVDGLDECSEGSRILAEILRLPSTLSLMVTSRRISTIEIELEHFCCLEIHAPDKDVREYIQRRIDDSGRLKRHLPAHPDLRKHVVDTVANTADGL